MTFTGYPHGLGLLDDIGRATQDSFRGLQADWEKDLLRPTRDLVDTIGPMIGKRISRKIKYVSRAPGSISPIHRDLRFAPPGTPPYKDHLMLSFWDGLDRKTAPTLRARISNNGVGFSTGASFDAAALERYRAALLTPRGVEFADALAALGNRVEMSLAEPKLKNPAVAVPQDSPVRELLKHKTFQVRFIAATEPPARSPEMAEWMVANFEQLTAVHKWLLTVTQG